MKIAFITLFEYPFFDGGSGIYATELTKALAKLNHEIHMIAPHISIGDCPKFEIKEGVYVHRVKIIDKRLLRAPSYWLSLKNGFRKVEKKVGNFDIVHSNGPSDFGLIQVNSPRILTIHHLSQTVLSIIQPYWLERITNVRSEIGIFSTYIEKTSIKRAKKIIAISSHTKRQLISMYNVPDNKIETIYNGIKYHTFNFSDIEKMEIKSKFSLPESPIVLFVGRIDSKIKGMAELLKAFQKVKSRSEATLLIVGGGKQEPFQSLACSLGIDKNIVFTGYIDEQTLIKLYSIADIFVLPSKLEGFGLVLGEAMAAGKPIVATKAGAIPEVVKDGENGILVEPGNIDDLAKGIISLLENEKLSKSIGKRNRKIIEKFSWERAAQQTEEVYISALTKKIT